MSIYFCQIESVTFCNVCAVAYAFIFALSTAIAKAGTELRSASVAKGAQTVSSCNRCKCGIYVTQEIGPLYFHCYAWTYGIDLVSYAVLSETYVVYL